MGGQVVWPGAGPELLQGVRLDVGAGQVNFQGQSRAERAGTFHHRIQTRKALRRHMAPGRDLSTGAVEIHPDEHFESV